MSSQPYNEEHLNYLQKQIIEIAKGVLSENIGIVAGTRRLIQSDLLAGGSLKDPDIKFLIGLNSETDQLPIGEVRKHWNPEALKEKDSELATCEAKFRERAFEVCRRLIEKYSRTCSN
jgi:hypothetical protein